MNRSEAFTIGKIDRDRAKAGRSARSQMIETAARTWASAFVWLNDEERACFAKHLIRHSREELMLCEGPVEAATFLQKQSQEAGRGIVAATKEHAEQVFAKGRGE